jgi:hypothetical protein
VLELCSKILASGKGVLSEVYKMVWFPGDDLWAETRPRGLPIGNLTSQFWANVYLNPFDHFVKRELRCKGYLRYVDDYLLFSNSKAELWEWQKQIIRRMAKLRLINHHGAQVKPVGEGIPFLGFTIFPQKRRLKRRKGIYYQRRFRAMLVAYGNGLLSLEELSRSVQGWTNHVRYGNTVGLRKVLLGVTLPRRTTGRENDGV